MKKPLAVPNVSQTAETSTAYLFNTVFADAPLQESTVADYKSCSTICLGNIHCVAFSYLRASTKCKLFNRVEGYYRDDAYDSGYKWQLPPKTWSGVVRSNR